MKPDHSYTYFWQALFFLLIPAYALYYGPYGINETDGGVFTGLAWQLEQGKQLYRDLVYVRPPLTVWLRWLELRLLPEHLAILGERWIFYLRLGIYSGLAAALLQKGKARWQLACLGFVVSAHNFPPMIWHTTDGVFFSVVGCWLLFKTDFRLTWMVSGICMVAAMLCKQSFYPLGLLFPVMAYLSKRKAFVFSLGGMALATAWFFGYLVQNHLLANFISMTTGSTAPSEALQHGLLDYVPESGVLLLTTALVWQWKKRNLPMNYYLLPLGVVGVILLFALRVWMHQEYTVPWHETRFFFLLACLVLAKRVFTKPGAFLNRIGENASSILLLGIGWCTAISWGYNLPIFLGVPLVWGVMEVGRQEKSPPITILSRPAVALVFLLLVFGYAHQFVYRDGKREQMDCDLGSVFPSLTGIYSTPETLAQYRELRDLAHRYPNFKTVPAFPSAHFLTHTRPPLALDWLIDEEIGAAAPLVKKTFVAQRPVLFLERAYLPGLYTAPHLKMVQHLLTNTSELERTPHFIVLWLTPAHPQYERK